MSAQKRKTDERIIEEDWRYSHEKKFNTWSISAGYGMFFMVADVTDYNIFPNNIRFTPSAILSKQLAPALAIDLKYLYGNMYGKSVYPLDIGTGVNEQIGIYFKGNLHDISLNTNFYLNQMIAMPGPINDRWNVFLKIGAGVSLFRSRLHLLEDDSFVIASDLNIPSSGYLVNGYELHDPEVKTARRAEVVVPATAGVMYRINNHLDISMEASLHLTASDHFDNILKGTSNDSYPYVGVYLHYIFGKKDRRHSRWTYRGLGFDLFGRPKKDPLVTEVALLEDDIQKFIDAREPKIHVVEITNEETVVYQPVFIRTIFFPQDGNIKFNSDDIVLMAETAVQMKSNPDATLHLYSYVDENDAGNHDEFSKQQCEKIIDFLVNELAADKSKIEIHPLGSSEPLATGEEATPETKKTGNRRVDMVLVL